MLIKDITQWDHNYVIRSLPSITGIRQYFVADDYNIALTISLDAIYLQNNAPPSTLKKINTVTAELRTYSGTLVSQVSVSQTPTIDGKITTSTDLEAFGANNIEVNFNYTGLVQGDVYYVTMLLTSVDSPVNVIHTGSTPTTINNAMMYYDSSWHYYTYLGNYMIIAGSIVVGKNEFTKVLRPIIQIQ